LVGDRDRSGRGVVNDHHPGWLGAAFVQRHRVLEREGLRDRRLQWEPVAAFMTA
jgi:hypothetical protein